MLPGALAQAVTDQSGQSAADHLAQDDRTLLGNCDVNVHRASGPGGQHRNKVSTAVRLTHRATGITATAYDSRSQHENRATALKRLRMKIACQHRRAVDPEAPAIPKAVASCLFTPHKGPPTPAARRLQVGRKDRRFWAVVQFLLDVLEACEGRLSDAAGKIGITTSNLAAILKEDRHSWAAAAELRKRHGLGPLK